MTAAGQLGIGRLRPPSNEQGDSANERCPLFPGAASRLHWSFDDPSAVTGAEDERLAAFRGVRDAIRARLQQWLEEV